MARLKFWKVWNYDCSTAEIIQKTTIYLIKIGQFINNQKVLEESCFLTWIQAMPEKVILRLVVK